MKLFGLILFAGAAFAQMHGDLGDGKRHPAFTDPTAIEAGRRLYLVSCGGCHGPGGEGGRGINLREGQAVRRLSDAALFRSIKDGVPGSDMPPSRLEDEKLWQISAFVRSFSAPAAALKLPGDAELGRALFFGKAGCGGCHRVGREGGWTGPDLSDVGGTRSAGSIRESIVSPDERIVEGYNPATVTLKDGRVIKGAARNHTNYSVQLLDAKGNLHLLSSTEIAGIVLSYHSPMPGDYAKRLTPAEVTNLVAFLGKQAARPVVLDQLSRRRRGQE